jgi:acyl transferase domain-containing protein
MTQARDPAALSVAARDLADRMESDASLRLDVAYQLLRAIEQIDELHGDLELERHRLDVCVSAMAVAAPEEHAVRRVLRRGIAPLLFFTAGIVTGALLVAYVV